MLKKFHYGLFLFVCAAVFAVLPVRAGTVKSVKGGSGAKSDYQAIKTELEKTGYVKLVKGETYNLGSHVLHVKSNWMIDATGATVKGTNCILLNIPACTGYKAINNFHIKGGTWISSKKNGVKKSAIKISHGENISFTNMNIRWCSLNNHSIELVGCRNVKIKGCHINGLGKGSSKSVEEAIQIDLAAPKTAPFLEEYKARTRKLWNGAACENVVIDKCWVRGCRGICANFAANDAKAGRKQYLGMFHRNITISNNTIVGVKSEGLALFNVLSSRVRNNKIYSMSGRTSTNYSNGCHCVLIGKVPAGSGVFTVKITGNQIYGGLHALAFNSQSASNYYKVVIEKNKLHCKMGKTGALSVDRVTKLVRENNSFHKW